MVPNYDWPLIRAARAATEPRRALVLGRQALIPWFAKVGKLEYPTCNARSEELTQKNLIGSCREVLRLHCAGALWAAGDSDREQLALAQDWDWIHPAARDQVTDEFRDGVLYRNPVNGAVARMAARHRLALLPWRAPPIVVVFASAS